ncbi:MFS transporter [Paenibacillus chungangensis]|uniref:MFS transporter n=1 Tax=Paenibacillus chungangensis TaxID=696535 RepID=A0ABW3HQN5_9BACL
MASNVYKLYAIRFFHSLIPAYVIERLFWEERGMTIPLVVYTEIIFAVIVLLAELPTGILADKWGRKPMLVLSAIIGCLEFLLLVFATEFWHFALVIALTAVGRASASGAEHALLYESLQLAGKKSSFEKVLGRLAALDIAGTMVAALCGSLLAASFGFELNYWLSFSSMAVCLAVTLMLAESDSSAIDSEGEKAGQAAQTEPGTMKQYIAASLQFFRAHPGAALVVLSGMLIGAAINFIDEFWQLYLDRLGIPLLAFGLFSSIIFLIRLPGSLLAYKLKNRFSYRTLITVSLLVSAAGYIFLGAIRHESGIFAIVLICLFAGMIEPLATGYLHHRIGSSSMRATIDSFQSLALNAAMAATGLGFGYFSSLLDIFGGFGFLGVVCAIYTGWYLIVSRRISD